MFKLPISHGQLFICSDIINDQVVVSTQLGIANDHDIRFTGMLKVSKQPVNIHGKVGKETVPTNHNISFAEHVEEAFLPIVEFSEKVLESFIFFQVLNQDDEI